MRATRLAMAAVLSLGVGLVAGFGEAASEAFKDNIYLTGPQQPRDSRLRVKVGQVAPAFALPSLSGETVRLRQFRGKKNVVLSFVPAAWTPVCSDQWPGYNLARDLFEAREAVLLGITVDNLPTLFSWTRQMGELWFPVLSDFWPHGRVAGRYGVLRSDGTAERALFVVDKKGILRWIDVHDINRRPPLEDLIRAMERLP